MKLRNPIRNPTCLTVSNTKSFSSWLGKAYSSNFLNKSSEVKLCDMTSGLTIQSWSPMIDIEWSRDLKNLVTFHWETGCLTGITTYTGNYTQCTNNMWKKPFCSFNAGATRSWLSGYPLQVFNSSSGCAYIQLELKTHSHRPINSGMYKTTYE